MVTQKTKERLLKLLAEIMMMMEGIRKTEVRQGIGHCNQGGF